ncbi:MAG: hypothetical protein ACTHOG_00885 [Marmoricola sp.]
MIIALIAGFVILHRRRWSRLRVVAVDGDLVTVTLGDLTVTAELAEDAGSQALRPEPGRALRAALHLVPSEDVEEGPPIGHVTQLTGPDYRVAGRVRATSPTHTDIVLENGYVLRVVGGEVAHSAELRGPAEVMGRLTMSAKRLM